MFNGKEKSRGPLLPGPQAGTRPPHAESLPSEERAEPASKGKMPKHMPSAHAMFHVIKHHFIAMTSEFLGTVFFLLYAFASVQIANTDTANHVNTADTERLMYIAVSFGLSLVVNAWIFYRISGGLFNPAVTMGMVAAGRMEPLRGALLFITQVAGGIAAAALALGLFSTKLNVDTTLGNSTSVVQGFFIEAFATFLLVTAVLMLAAEKSRATFLAPIGIGLTLFVTQLATVNFSGGSLNPTRSFGPAVVTRSFTTYHWIYWIGPMVGAVAASGYYRFIKYFDYEEANPGQDASDEPPM